MINPTIPPTTTSMNNRQHNFRREAFCEVKNKNNRILQCDVIKIQRSTASKEALSLSPKPGFN